MGPLLKPLAAAISVLAVIGLLPADAKAYAEKPTHEHLTRFAIPLLLGDGSYDEVILYKQVLEDATVAEDEKARCLHHFYDPTTGLGLPSNFLTRAYFAKHTGVKPIPGNEDGTRFVSAAIWARNGMPDKLDWEGAIEAYGNPALGETGHEQAWRAVGHVLHLVQDMAQPDHASDRPHPGNYLGSAFIDPKHPSVKKVGYESLWAALGDKWPHGTKPKELDSLEQAFLEIPTLSHTTEKALGVPFSDEYALGLGDLIASRSSGGPALSEAVRANSGGIVTDAFWVNFELHMPLQPLIVISPPDKRTSTYISLGEKMLPQAEEYSAGILRLFYRIVKPPPFVSSVTLTQADETEPRYKAEWITGKGARTLTRSDSGELLPGARVRVRLVFGPSMTLKGTDFTEAISETKVTIDIGSGRPAIPVIQDGLQIAKGIWEGHFDATDAGTLVIEARDQAAHFTRRKDPGNILDARPESIARAGKKAPYEWEGYTPGADRNHFFRIASGCTPAAVSAEMRKRSEWGGITGTYEVKKTYADGIRDPQNVADPSWESP